MISVGQVYRTKTHQLIIISTFHVVSSNLDIHTYVEDGQLFRTEESDLAIYLNQKHYHLDNKIADIRVALIEAVQSITMNNRREQQ